MHVFHVFQEWKERENIRMSRPLDPIPMPYVDPKKVGAGDDTVIPYDGERRACDKNTQGTTRIWNPNNLMMATLPAADKRRHNSSSVDSEFFTVRHFNKAFVVYYLMSEVEFKKERFGSALRLVKRSLNCYHVLDKLGFFTDGSATSAGVDAAVVLFLRKCYARAFDNASDCYVQMVHSWHKMVSFQVRKSFILARF